jgi:hypothetical protein
MEIGIYPRRNPLYCLLPLCIVFTRDIKFFKDYVNPTFPRCWVPGISVQGISSYQ